MKGNSRILTGLFVLFIAMGAVLAIKDENFFLRMKRNWISKENWFLEYKTISHALGGIDGKDYTNSLEALEYSYAKGQKVVEADFRFTEDGVLVCRHDWKDDLGQDSISGNSKPDLETFKSSLIFDAYTPMSAEDLIEWMSAHEDVYLVTDVKHSLKSSGFEKTIKEFVRLAKNKDASILNRVIIQIYCEEDFEKIEKIYPFESYIFTLYKKPEEYKNQYDKVSVFCKEKGISVVTMPANWIESAEDIEPLLENNIHVYVHTLNDLETVGQMLALGVNGIYTDFLYENDIREMESIQEEKSGKGEYKAE